MTDAAAQLENFLEAVSGNRKPHKTIQCNISEVKCPVSQSSVSSVFNVLFFSFLIETTGPSK